ncbi:MAG: hypothetical protein HY925_03100, partial [Elusimicrobia bacterium]|nr:hypothetical protein [Elusimicrobiota bacterium]
LSLACAGPAKKTAEFDVYLERFDQVRDEGCDIYLRASSIAEEHGGPKLEERRQAFETRLEALRIIDKYNRVLVGMARGEDPKSLKSGMKDVGAKLSNYRPSAQTTFAFASAVPYVGVLLSGAGYVQEALAKRNFTKAVREAHKPIDAILDILLVDSEPLEELLIQQVRAEQDGPRAAVDGLSSRFYKKLRDLKATPEVADLVSAHNALREKAGMGPVPYSPLETARMPRDTDVEHLAVLTDQVAVNLESWRRAESRVSAEQSLFRGYREALGAAKTALAALNKESEAEREAATGKFNAEAIELRQESLRRQEAN